MDNVGHSKSRNKEFRDKFSRERLLQNIVKAGEPVILDVGAHYGESVVYFKTLFPKASIYSFEPDPDSYKTLSSAAVSEVSYFNLALLIPTAQFHL
jgi:hypothetical protein